MNKEKKCRKVMAKISSFIDNEVNGREKELINHHINNCPLCSKEYEDLAKLNNIFLQLHPVEVPEDVMCGLKILPVSYDKKIAKLRLHDRLRPLAVAASILLTIFSALTVGNRLIDARTSDNIPVEYQLAQESLFSLWQEVSYAK